MVRHLVLVAVTLLAAAAPATQAQVLTQWTFNSPEDDGSFSTGTLAPNVGAGVFGMVGGVTGGYGAGAISGGSSDPKPFTDNSIWAIANFAPQGTQDRQRGVQFAVDTTGYASLVVSWDQRHNSTSARHAQFQYSLDGLNFTDFGAPFVSTVGEAWFNGRSVDLSTVAGVADNASFAFRIVAAFAPGGSGYAATNLGSTYATSGGWRFDMVTVQATAVPEPASWALMALGLAGLMARASRRH